MDQCPQPPSDEPTASAAEVGTYASLSLAFLQLFGWGTQISYFNDRENDKRGHTPSPTVITLQK